MSPPIPVKSVVKRRDLDGTKIAAALGSLTTTCNVGATATEVQTDPVCAAAHADLQAKVTAAVTGLTDKQAADQKAKVAGKKLFAAFHLVRKALATYETAVNAMAKGDAAIIHKAGSESRPEAPPTSPVVQRAEKLTSRVGKNARESVLRWAVTPGAAMFAVEANFDPQNPGSTWTSLGTTTRRTKAVIAPTAAAQFLVRVAALDSDGKAADWSDTILATAR